jgi:hypothetical protein
MAEEMGSVPGLVNEVLGSTGHSLDDGVRAYMEDRLGRDFSKVKVHTDARAAESARAVDALAYTVGKDVVFGSGQYAPATLEGTRLLAHELTHVAQNAGASASGPITIGPAHDRFEVEADHQAGTIARGERPSAGPSMMNARTGARLSRASFTVGPATVKIDYANLLKVADSESAIETMFTSWAGSPASTIHANLAKLSLTAKSWVLYALDLLVDNPVAGLDKDKAVARLIDYAPSSRFQPHADKPPAWNFANEALSVSGWFEKAITAGLTKPKGAMLSDVQTLINPNVSTSGSSSCPSARPSKDQLNQAKIETDLPGQLETYLKTYNQQVTSSTTPAQPMTQLVPLADPIQEMARSYYAGYADRGRGGGNTFVQQWQYSAHLASVKSPAGNPTKEKRLAYLDSRARKVGGGGLFSQVHYDSRCDADELVLDGIVQKMEKRNDIQTLLDPILRQKSYTEQTASPKQVVLSPEADADECKARWKTIKTMCHELMHVMAHPDFRRAEKGRQILTEGFPEVLGHWLYQDIKSKAQSDNKIKSQMEAGLSAACPTIPDSTIEYKDAGQDAEKIRQKVGPERFRSAFFLGQLEMVGIQPKKINGAPENNAFEREAEEAAHAATGPQPQQSRISRAPFTAARLAFGSGAALESKVRREMESRLAHDFGAVRVHTDSEAAKSASAMQAHAYTTGRDIFFAAGRYSPKTADGRRLIAHELTHVVQQSNVGPRVQLRPPWEGRDDPLERDALDAERGWSREPFGDRGPGSGTMSWREAMETLPPTPRPRPAAAQVRDPRPRVLPAERAAFSDLQTYVAGLPTRLRALVGSGAASEPWLTSTNSNVQSALRVLDQLSNDLSSERFVVRFDQPAGTNVAAVYDSLNDVMHLRPYNGVRERTVITIDLLHEYTHVLQDREAERVFVNSTAPHVHTRQEDLARETQARQEQVYFGEMLRVLGDPVPDSAIFGSQLSDRVFRGRFERERTGRTSRERGAATREIRAEIETAYASQLATNSSIKTYRIEITSSNHALLYLNIAGATSPRDLGLVPAGITERDPLSAHLERSIRALPEFSRLSNAGGGRRFTILTFAITYNGDHVMEFGIQP